MVDDTIVGVPSSSKRGSGAGHHVRASYLDLDGPKIRPETSSTPQVTRTNLVVWDVGTSTIPPGSVFPAP